MPRNPVLHKARHFHQVEENADRAKTSNKMETHSILKANDKKDEEYQVKIVDAPGSEHKTKNKLVTRSTHH